MSRLNHLHSSGRSKTKKKDGTKRIQQNNYTLVTTLITILGFLVLIQAFRWQVLESEKFKTMAQDQYQDSQTQTTQRGLIKASEGSSVLTNEKKEIEE